MLFRYLGTNSVYDYVESGVTDVWGRVLQKSNKGLQILDLEQFASMFSSSNMQLWYKHMG